MSQKRWVVIILGMSIIFTAFLLMLSGAPLPDRTPTPITVATATASATATSTVTPTATPTPVPKPNIGVQGQFIGPDGDAGIRLAADLGAGWIKQQVDWNSAEYARGLYHWGELDQLVAEAEKYGLKIMFSVARAPGFSRPEPVEEDGPPNDLSIFRDFMHALSKRYKGRVAAYELWNEPNLRREWRGFDLSAEKFVELIKAGSSGVREGDPEAVVISGAPATTGIDDKITAIDDRVYLRAMIAAGVADYVDAIGAHPYGAGNPPDERAADAAHVRSGFNTHPSFFFLDTIEDYHAILLEAQIDLPIWITEFGWPSIDQFGEVDTSGWEYAREVTEQDQAAYLLRSIELRRDRMWVGPLIIWNLNIAPLLGADRSESAYGLIRPDGVLRPAYQQLNASGE
ncbi:MAG: hypothetical protein HY870_25200 [Chloroflexi bacterium]|nr:hypothetical protein [Chloroflexota bacterium]